MPEGAVLDSGQRLAGRRAILVTLKQARSSPTNTATVVMVSRRARRLDAGDFAPG